MDFIRYTVFINSITNAPTQLKLLDQLRAVVRYKHFALANKMVRICYATLRDKEPFGEEARLAKKINRESFVMPV
jgi:disulfide oxidoreductase YuzD